MQDQEELMAILDMLEKKELYQKAANLLCPIYQVWGWGQAAASCVWN